MLKYISSFFKTQKKLKTVLFYRNFKSFQGGHLKTWNYYNNLKQFSGFKPLIYFSEDSTWEQNPWLDNCAPEATWDPNSADILFLAGLDWSALENFSIPSDKPIINLIQHVRHANSEDIRYQYLDRRAIRICVSEQVTSALLSTNRVNGPLFTIKNGIDLDEIKNISSNVGDKEFDVFVSGIKNKGLATKISEELIKLDIRVECQIDTISRYDYLNKLASSKVSLMLPSATEGFYLPALESMATGSLAICPDCIGNRGFCKDKFNCYMPEYQFESLMRNTVKALNLDDKTYTELITNAFQTANKYSLSTEKESFYKIMKNIDNIWQS